MTPRRSFAEALERYPLLFEPVPPPARAGPTRVAERLAAVVSLVRSVERIDALVLPELVDENHEGRPRYRSGDPSEFASALQATTGREAVLNKVVAYLDDPTALERWVGEVVGRGLRHLVLVGGASRYIPYPGPSVVEADRRAAPTVRSAGGRLGNIAIPQRAGEPHRMLAKTRAGATFFTTQLIFDAEQVLQMVRQYDLLCRQASIPPAAVLLSVAPLADEQDVEFVRWLGADLPEAAERAILAGDDAEAVRRSLDRALDVWARVLEGTRSEELAVPLGVNVEQVSVRHLDVAGELLRAFAERLPPPSAPDPSTPEAATGRSSRALPGSAEGP